ncbi:YbaY family lipoprotein [Arthrobacter sp. MDT3-44]
MTSGPEDVHMSLIPRALSGTVLFDPARPVPPGTVLHVIVEDTTRADAAAGVAASLSLTVEHPPGNTGLSFVLSVPEVNPKVRYEVRVHADLDGDGRVSRGDQISTVSTPVFTEGHPSKVTIRLASVP